jgi:predicted outer membrane lipoprotein
MKTIIKFIALAVILVLALLLAVVTGDLAPWYFAWLVGTMMIVLIAASGAVMFEAQQAESRGPNGSTDEI